MASIQEAVLSEFALKPRIPERVPITHDPEEFISAMKPGDIINTRTMAKYRGFKGPGRWSYTLSLPQQEYFPHSAFYLGGGKVFNAIPTGTFIVSVNRFIKKSPVLLLRPRATPQQKKEAIKFIKHAHKKGMRVTLWGTVKTVAHKAKRKLLHKKFKEKKRPNSFSVICSNLISIAYKDINFTTKSPKKFVTPSDLSRSKMTKKVMIYLPEGLNA